MAAKLTRLTHE